MQRILYVFCVALLLALPISAQTLGDITGIVTDSSGAVVANATVTITNKGTGASREAKSNDSGLYAFPALTPGLYDLKAVAAGFKTSTFTNVELQVQQSLRLDFDLAVGQVSESVEVNAAAATLSTENSTVGTVIENKRIVDLPLNGRNALSLAALSPNVSFGFPSAGQAGSRQGGIRTDRSISVAGQRGQFNHFTLDGIENTDPNFNTYIVEPSVDALLEFKVQTGIYPAEFGRGATQINMSTKGGANDYHGTLFHFLRNEKLDAKNYAFTANRPPKDPFKWNQFGFTVSGPISIPKLFNGKNKLFFMTNYEWFRQRRNTQAVYDLPSTAMRGGNFAELPLGTTGIFDPATRATVGGVVTAQQFPGNVIPSSRIQGISRQLLEFYPSPNVAGATGLRRNFVQAQSYPINRDQFVGRFDFVESANSQWFGRYSWGDENQLQSALLLNGDKIVTNFNQYTATNTRVITPSIVNEFRFGFSQFYNTTGPELAFTRDVVGELKIPGLASGPPVQWGIPNVSLQGFYAGIGNGSEGPYENNNSALQFINNLSWTKGKHNLKFGLEVRRDAYNQVGNQFARGQFTFQRTATNNLAAPAGTITGDTFADFLLGNVFQAEAAVSIANAQFRAISYAAYFDDNWKVTNRLTINYGLRYELTPPWEDQTDTLFNGIVPFDARTTLAAPNVADQSQYPFFMRQGASRQNCYEGINLRWPNINVRCDGSLGNRLVQTDRNDFAPRFGITWSPSDKWVIRSGAGYFYSQDTGNPRFDMSRNLAGRLRDNTNVQFPNLTWNNSLAAIAGGVANVPRPYTFANPYDRRTPFALQYMFNVQRELFGDTQFEVGYLGSVSRRLESLRAVNEAIPANPATDRRAVFERSPFPNFGRIQLVDNHGVGSYNSLGAKLTKRFSKGVTYLVSYTWARSIDTATAIRNQGGDTLFPQNSYCRACEKARSSHDVNQRFVTSALWDLPFGKGRPMNIENGFLNTIVGGWQVGSIITIQSGFPITVTNGQDASNTGAFFDRPNSTGVSAQLDNPDPVRWFNTSAFTANLPGTHGNVGRNTLTGPSIFGWDFSLLKDFNFTERNRLQFRFEAFNFPNHPNWGNPNTNISSGGSFGTITGTRTNMRNLQFALKYIF
ncbi:MAG: TonB-dependent receptor [Bryobacteraceae bacterium]|nr:TonB-dependent receptor [Bryobacteraceae bacterium]